MSKTVEVESPLMDFSWDEGNPLGDLFGGKTDEAPKVDTDIKDNWEEEGDEEKDEEDGFIEPPKEEPKEGTPTKKEEEVSIYTDVYKDLKDYGILKHVSIEEGKNLSAEELQKLYQEDYDKEVEERITSWAAETLDEEAQAFIKFKRNGGKTKDFLNLLETSSLVPEGDIEDEDFQDEVIRYQLTQEDYTKEEIEDLLQTYTEKGNKKVIAKRYNDKIQRELENDRKMLLKSQEEEAARLKKSRYEFDTTVKQSLLSNSNFSGFTVSDSEKDELYKFITQRSIQLQNGMTITGLQKKLGEVFQDTNKMIALSKILYKDFDMSDFKKKVVTEQTRKIKSNLENRKGLYSSGSGSSHKGSSLADLFG